MMIKQVYLPMLRILILASGGISSSDSLSELKASLNELFTGSGLDYP